MTQSIKSTNSNLFTLFFCGRFAGTSLREPRVSNREAARQALKAFAEAGLPEGEKWISISWQDAIP
jgi:Tfp pilus assembly protein PilX